MTSAYDFEEEARWEVRAADAGVARYRKAAEAADPATLPAGQKLIRETVGPLVAAFEANRAFVAASNNKTCRSKALRWLAEGESMVQAAGSVSVIVSHLLSHMVEATDYREGRPTAAMAKLCHSVASYLIVCRENAMWLDDKEDDLVKRFKLRYPTPTAEDWKAFRDEHSLERIEMGDMLETQVGGAVLGWLVDGSPEWFTSSTVQKGVRTTVVLTLTPQAIEVLSDVTARAEVAHPLLMPMLLPPNDWRYDEKGNLEGAYAILQVDALRGPRGYHTRALKRPISEDSLVALNAVQSTPWAINLWLHEVAEEAHRTGLIVGDQAPELPVPPRRSDAEWATMSKEDQSAYSRARREAFENNVSARGQADALLNTLAGAAQLTDKPAFYYPHSLDFRGRIYPVPTWGPHPQGNDLARSLIHFAEGRSLGEDGLFWLYIRAANCAGQDKLPLEDRVQWCLDHTTEMHRAASAPMEDTWWTKLDEPWGFLATSYELYQAFQMDDPAEFRSHLPVPLDGSCNGLQHLSAMALDIVGATATNLRAGLPRQDIYEEVAAECRDIVERDIRDNKEEALLWQGKVTRKAVKRAVMTTPYGVTKNGIRQQLIHDGHAPGGGTERGRAADYLKDCLIEALDRKAGAARGIMAWLQAVAFRLAEAEIPFVWSTPSGNCIQQAYRVQTARRVRTLVGNLLLMSEETTSGLDAKKQSLGAAPNYVHSFDAAHLTNTVVACLAEGIIDFSVIHDSYGTHACNTTALARLLRDEFVAIYHEDWLRKLYDELRDRHPHVDIPEPPARGDFSLEEVHQSDFFFS